MKTPRLSIVMPSWQRPMRTRRAIRSVLAQDCQDWELIVVGDRCPCLADIELDLPDPRISYLNLAEHEGHYGTAGLNVGIGRAAAPYLCFMGNDDLITPTHVTTRLAGIEGTEIDFTYADAVLRFDNGDNVRHSALQFGMVGGSELTVKTPLARLVQFKDRRYGHDWTFIQGLINAGAKFAHVPSATYIVMGTMSFREAGID